MAIFNLMVPAQFWAFANDLYTPEAGKRLFVIVAFGASSGAVAGSYLDALLIGTVGLYELMLVAAGILVASLLLTNLVAWRERSRPDARATKTATHPEDAPLKEGNAFALVARNRYLLLIAFLMLVLNWVNTTGEYILGRTVVSAVEDAVTAGTAGGLSEEEYIGGFYAGFFTGPPLS